jgi:hypothetical protein
MYRLTRTVRSALLVAALVIAPAAARAATITEPIVIQLFTASISSSDEFNSQPFPKFDPTLGTLNDVSMSVTGSGTWIAFAFSDQLIVQLDGRQGFFSGPQTFLSVIPGTRMVNFNLSGTTNAAAVLAEWTGQGNNQVSLQIVDVTGADFLTANLVGTFTFDYTPTAAVPEPSTWAMMLLGFAGLGFAFRHSRHRTA